MHPKTLLLFVALMVAGVPGKSISPNLQLNAPKVQLALYYETLCPDSMAFVRDQLSVTYPALKNILDVDINSFGKATFHPSTHGGFRFECQHGPHECSGNMMLACAKKYITDNSTYVDFNICVMSATDPPTAGRNCAQSLGLSYANIFSCTSQVEGQRLLKEEGVETQALQPPLTSVPWVVVDGRHTALVQMQALHNLTSVVCRAYQGVPPAACLERQ